MIPLLLMAIGAQRLAILPATVEGPYGDAPVLEMFETVAKAADLRVGIELVSYNALFVDGVEPVATTVRDCGSDLACIGRALRLARIDLGLRVIANFALDPPLFTFSLIEGERTIAEKLVEAEGSIDSILVRSTEELLAAYPRGGRIAVEVAPPDAVVSIAPPGSGVMAPGTYRVSAAKEGYSPKSAAIDLRAGSEERVRLVLDPLPEESIASSPWLWTGVGVGVAAIVTVVLIVTNPFARSPSEGIVCVTTPMGGC